MIARNQDVHELADGLPKGAVIMLTSIALDGRLNTRPMILQAVDPAGSLWFFIGRASLPASEIAVSHQVSVAHCGHPERRYVALTGKAWLVEDLPRVRELWRGDTKAWFPQGVDDPDLTLLRVDPQSGERWQDGIHHVHFSLEREPTPTAPRRIEDR